MAKATTRTGDAAAGGGGLEQRADAAEAAAEEVEVGFLFEQAAIDGRGAAAPGGVEGERIVRAVADVETCRARRRGRASRPFCSGESSPRQLLARQVETVGHRFDLGATIAAEDEDVACRAVRNAAHFADGVGAGFFAEVEARERVADRG